MDPVLRISLMMTWLVFSLISFLAFALLNRLSSTLLYCSCCINSLLSNLSDLDMAEDTLLLYLVEYLS
jgi:hypothetical protein